EAYKKGDCEAAIALFDQFISRYPSSALLPEATLNRAECYLKLPAK
ncbi:tetratricopeptide repeat protein, partial [Trichlorobacter sp.]